MLYERVGDLAKAAECYLRAGNVAAAARCHLALGRPEAAAACWESQGDPLRAALELAVEAPSTRGARVLAAGGPEGERGLLRATVLALCDAREGRGEGALESVVGAVEVGLGGLRSPRGRLEVEEAVVRAALAMGSEADRAQVLGAVLRKDGWGREAALKVLKAVAEIHSEEAKERVLRELPEAYLRDKAVAAAYIDAAHTIRSGDRYRRVMSALYEKRGEK